MVPVLSALLLGALIATDDPGQRQQAAAGPEVQALTPDAWKRLKDDRKGKGLLVNVWATWCVPCVEEFPELVRLHTSIKERKVDLAVVSIDFDDEVDTKVRPFLRRMNATMPAYINAFPTPDGFIDALHPEWSGAVPVTAVFDADGRRVALAVGKQTYQQFEALARRAEERSQVGSDAR